LGMYSLFDLMGLFSASFSVLGLIFMGVSTIFNELSSD
jgi:hypothetical protein